MSMFAIASFFSFSALAAARAASSLASNGLAWFLNKETSNLLQTTTEMKKKVFQLHIEMLFYKECTFNINLTMPNSFFLQFEGKLTRVVPEKGPLNGCACVFEGKQSLKQA